MTILTLVRHGETDWNRDGRIQGASDIPLNDAGREQARALGRSLRESRDAAVPLIIVSSDLSRAAETADLLAAELGTGVLARYPGLRERAYGEAEGMRTDEFHRRWGDWHRAEVPGSEPWPLVRERALASIERVVRDARRATAPVGPDIVAVSHGALIRQVIRHATGDGFPLTGERLPNGSAHSFLVERERLRLLAYAAV